MYNLQSGIHRQRFPARLTPKQAKELKIRQHQAQDLVETTSGSSQKYSRGQGKHTGAITGIAVDSLNRTVITCGEDGKVKVRMRL
jgi:U3 small nucleolar RNA-associated protein 21